MSSPFVSARYSAPMLSENNMKPLKGYARKVAGNNYLSIYKTQPAGYDYPWLFAHRANSKGAVHALTIFKDGVGKEFVHLLVNKRPPMGGKLVVELPAGLWGDNKSTEDALSAANREVKEETGFDPWRSALLANQLFATSPGMTTEMKAIAITKARGIPSRDHLEKTEQFQIVETLDVPINTFRQYDKFRDWLAKMNHNGYIVGMDVIAARGLMPPKRLLDAWG